MPYTPNRPLLPNEYQGDGVPTMAPSHSTGHEEYSALEEIASSPPLAVRGLINYMTDLSCYVQELSHLLRAEEGRSAVTLNPGGNSTPHVDPLETDYSQSAVKMMDSVRIPQDIPNDIQRLIHAHENGIPVAIIARTDWPPFPFQMNTPLCKLAVIGYFHILSVKVCRSPS